MRCFITGIAGVLGSALARHFVDKGYEIKGNDKVRIEEAWRLEGYKDKITYAWKSSIDLKSDDIEGFDVLFDCALESADRPFGIDSPIQTTYGNIMAPLGVLEAVRRTTKKPVCIYPSSFNVFYGHKADVVINEETPPLTSSVYGWTKLAAEQLYLTYYKAYGLPVIITRVGSAFCPRMRSDELVGRLMIHALLGKDFYLRSPYAKRLWCFGDDVIDFYDKLLDKMNESIGMVLHCAGNKNDEILTNMDIACMVNEVVNGNMKINEGHYEAGEKINGIPIDFAVDSSKTKQWLKWEPNYSVKEGMRKTKEWFESNKDRYTVV